MRNLKVLVDDTQENQHSNDQTVEKNGGVQGNMNSERLPSAPETIKRRKKKNQKHIKDCLKHEMNPKKEKKKNLIRCR